MSKTATRTPSLRHAQISPTAVLLTGAAVVAAMIIGLTGPRLRDRHGSAQQEIPVGELGYGAERAELFQAFDLAREQPHASTPDAARIAAITLDAFGASIAPPDLSSMGFTAVDARIVDLAAGVRALGVLYKSEGESEPRVLSLYATPDHGQIVRMDGFGSAFPFAPGDEWAAAGTPLREGPRRMLYATTDRSNLWLMVAPDLDVVVQAAPLIARAGE